MSEHHVNDDCFHFSRMLIFRGFFPSVFLVVWGGLVLLGKQYRSAATFIDKIIKKK